MSFPVEKSLNKAKKHFKNGEKMAAAQLYQAVLSKFPKNQRAIEGLKRITGTQSPAPVSRSIPPQDRLNALVDLYSRQQFQETEHAALELIEKYQNFPALYNILGLARAGLGQYDAAIKCYQRALDLNPVYVEAYTNIGVALKHKGDLDGAIDSYKQALAIKPDEAGIYRNIATAQLEKGAFEAAIEALQTALRIVPDFMAVHSVLCEAFLGKGDWDAAIISYKNAL